MNDLPPGWTTARLGDVAEVILGQSPPGRSYNTIGEGLPFFQGKAEFGKLHPTVRKWTTEPKKLATKGDILLSVRAPVGPTNIASVTCAIGRGLHAIRPADGMNRDFVLWALRNSVDRLMRSSTGSTFAAVTGDQVRTHGIQIAPALEQKRIVERIREVFARLDGTESMLRSLLDKLNLLRSAILANAFHTNHDLPVGWILTTVEDVCLPVYKTDPRKSPDVEFEYIDIGSVGMGSGKIVATRTFLGMDAPSRARQVVKAGDTVLSTVRTYQKKTALVPGVLDQAIASTGFSVLRPSDGVHPYFLFFQVFGDEFVRSLNKKQTGTSYPAVREKDVKSMPFRLAPLSEQEAIAADTKDNFNRIDTTTALVENLVNRVALLRRSVLTEAFAGRLVPQDPDDEPASVLLERITASRPAKPKRRGKAHS